MGRWCRATTPNWLCPEHVFQMMFKLKIEKLQIFKLNTNNMIVIEKERRLDKKIFEFE